jgi:hypothetical protein
MVRNTMRIQIEHELKQPSLQYTSPIGRWLAKGAQVGVHAENEHPTEPWYKVIWLTGVDYFSTLGYQPGIALLAAGAIAPIAAVILVLVTLLGALPVYMQVAGRSYAGQGSIAMLENLLSGWKSKFLVLVLLGFVATDFVMTMTMSAADAAKHAIENPFLHPYLAEAQIGVTLLLLALLVILFLKGFKEAIGIATFVTIPYLVLNLIVVLRGIWEVIQHPDALSNWKASLAMHGDLHSVLLASVLVFPRLALGLSGFETGVSVMPLVEGAPDDSTARGGPPPRGRIRNTRKLLAAAALIMSVMLILSSFVTTLLIPPEDYQIGGKASGRALAYLAHNFFGNVFGSVYDIATIVILALAGASAITGLLLLIPRYLPRFGMAPAWAALSRPLVLVIFAITIIVTLVFRANVEAQAGAYATGVLVLILSAALAATITLKHERRWLLSAYCGIVTLVFAYTLVDNCIERPDGLIIGSVFIVLTLTVSGISRAQRSLEFRVSSLYYTDEESAAISKQIIGRKIHMVPVRTNTPEGRTRKRAEISSHYRVDGPFAFVHVSLLDNRSEFKTPIELEVRRVGEDYCVEVCGANSIANTLAYLSEILDPISVFFELTRGDLMHQAVRYLLWGEGEIGLMVYAILLRYWRWTIEDDLRPNIYLMSN